MYENELYHHGIIGQKWGSRNGPPYPLNSGVSKKIKSGHNPKYEKDEKYKKEREKLRSGEDVDTVGSSLFRKKKEKRGLFNKKQKVKDVVDPYESIQEVQHILDEDSKFLDSRKFSSKSLENLTSRFQTEANYNDALSRRYESENRMMNNHKARMSNMQMRKYEKMIRKMEVDTAYNNMINAQIQSQINLMRSKETLKQLTTKPRKKSLVRRGAEWSANWAKNSIQSGLNVVGSQASAILFSELFNAGMNKLYTKSKSHPNPSPGSMANNYINPKQQNKNNNNNNN